MIEQHGSSSAVITGSSTHNERIERLLRDVYRCVTSLFYDVFYRLESEGKLDPLNETDLYCLHYFLPAPISFLPHINETLSEFDCPALMKHYLNLN